MQDILVAAVLAVLLLVTGVRVYKRFKALSESHKDNNRPACADCPFKTNCGKTDSGRCSG